MNPATKLMVEKLRQLAAEGKTYRQAAAAIGASYPYVAQYASKFAIPFRKLKRGPRPSARAADREQAMLALYRDGKTLEEIGKSYHLTRERVRQLLARDFGTTSKDGGKSELARRSKKAKHAARDARSMKAWGCNHSDYLRILRHPDKPTYSYWQQRRNAIEREIPWELNLWQWWQTWQKSGHWDERGRHADEYVMCRLNDVGPYAVDNVYIATSSDNMKDYWTIRRAAKQLIQEVCQ